MEVDQPDWLAADPGPHQAAMLRRLQQAPQEQRAGIMGELLLRFNGRVSWRRRGLRASGYLPAPSRCVPPGFMKDDRGHYPVSTSHVLLARATPTVDGKQSDPYHKVQKLAIDASTSDKFQARQFPKGCSGPLTFTTTTYLLLEACRSAELEDWAARRLQGAWICHRRRSNKPFATTDAARPPWHQPSARCPLCYCVLYLNSNAPELQGVSIDRIWNEWNGMPLGHFLFFASGVRQLRVCCESCNSASANTVAYRHRARRHIMYARYIVSS